MDRNDFTPEQLEKARACETTEELLALAKEEGIELSDEQLDEIAGGWTPNAWESIKCPACGTDEPSWNGKWGSWVCRSCGHIWKAN